MFDVLTETLSNSHESVENIANSTESTAEAIQAQAEICGQILDQTSHAGTVTNDMISASERVAVTVNDGIESVKELGEQARNVSQCSKEVESVVAKLTEKVEKVENFVDTIISISSQTNLLALNASIEAARAGEAGRGFSVVAEEIRKLSEDTKEASNNITNIIHELIEDTRNANASIEASGKCVATQNEILTQTWSKFGIVADEVKNLSSNIDDVKSGMETITTSSNNIFDHISQLSATSQEVAASSSESLENSNITVQEVEKCRKIFESIYVLAQDLQNV
jgi:methyl-accepting chemotaxis protein